MAAATVPAAQPAALRAVRSFLSSYGLIIVLLIMPVAFGIHDLRTDGNLARLGNNLENGALERLDLGARRDRLHARLRHRRAHQLRPRRGLHARLVRRRRASSRTIGLTATTGIPGLILGLILALIVAMVAMGALNVMIERVAYRPLRNAPKLAPLITAVGFSFILQNVGAVVARRLAAEHHGSHRLPEASCSPSPASTSPTATCSPWGSRSRSCSRCRRSSPEAASARPCAPRPRTPTPRA